jgi:thioester reductase-like protein
MMHPDARILVTGATGALGKGLVRELLATTGQGLVLVVRGKGRLSPEDRVRRMLAASGLDGMLGTRVEVLEGDVTRPDLGLSVEERARLRREVVAFHHVAALTALSGAAEPFRRVNVGGTVEALRLAWDLFRNGRLQRFVHVSTAFVAGSRGVGHVMEDELIPGPDHANAYESTKHEAEQLVRRASAEGLPTTVVRPSIVVGDSATGAVSDFNVIYPLMKLFAHGIVSTLPARAESTFNVVPIDFVTRALVAFARRPDSIGRTYHLVTERPPSIATLLRVKDAEFPSMPHVAIVDPSSPGLGADALKWIEPYQPYLDCRLTFDTTNTRAALSGTDIPLPRTDAGFLANILRYAVGRGYLIA